ncbi:S-adenosylmethionine:tRNA ribosyltransferase-isomerase, partial [Paenibacillus sepulcri]|nr:S-adenosylmethionine:tRNA ribosyltransferase-isomerase [Paenibacillus sepulcri]
MNVDDFDFELPESLIAQTPLADRTASRLLSLSAGTGVIGHHRFVDLLTMLVPGDTIILNDTRVMPARLLGIKADTGAKAELLLLKQLAGDRWETLAKPGKRLKVGAELIFGEDSQGQPLLKATIIGE